MLKVVSILALTINGAASLSISEEATKPFRDRADKRLELAKANTKAIPNGNSERSLTTSTTGWGQTTIYFDANCEDIAAASATSLNTCNVDVTEISGIKYTSCTVDPTSFDVTIGMDTYSGTGCDGAVTPSTFVLGSSMCTDNLDGSYSKVNCVSSPSYLDYGSNYYESDTCAGASESIDAIAYDVCIPFVVDTYQSVTLTGGCGNIGNLYSTADCTGVATPYDETTAFPYKSECQTAATNDDDYAFDTASSLQNYCNSASSLLPNAGFIAMVAVLASGFITAVF